MKWQLLTVSTIYTCAYFHNDIHIKFIFATCLQVKLQHGGNAMSNLHNKKNANISYDLVQVVDTRNICTT